MYFFFQTVTIETTFTKFISD